MSLRNLQLKTFRKFIGKRADFSTLTGKNLISISELSNLELVDLLDLSIELKNSWKKNPQYSRELRPLLGKSMSMIFQKRSTRTRVSTETGIFLLGGHALMLGPSDIQLGVNETLKDTGSDIFIDH